MYVCGKKYGRLLTLCYYSSVNTVVPIIPIERGTSTAVMYCGVILCIWWLCVCLEIDARAKEMEEGVSNI